MHERKSFATRIRDTPENRKSACYSFQFNRRCNRTALVVARTLHRLHRIRIYMCVCVERQCLRRMDTIQRQALLTETLKLYKSGIFVQVFASPLLPLPLPFARHFSTSFSWPAEGASRKEDGWCGVGNA